MFNNLKAEMTRRGVSKKQLAQKLNMSEWTLNRKLNGLSQFTLADMSKIKEVFRDSTISYLFFEALENA